MDLERVAALRDALSRTEWWERSLTLGWVRRAAAGRGLTITLEGRSGFRSLLGLET